MAKFLLGGKKVTDLSVSKKSIAWMIDFTLPEGVKENMPYCRFSELDGVFCMDFYSDPMVGDFITYKGHRWRIESREFAITRRTRRQVKSVPRLKVCYMGVLDGFSN